MASGLGSAEAERVWNGGGEGDMIQEPCQEATEHAYPAADPLALDMRRGIYR